jgi:hypothetical protein
MSPVPAEPAGLVAVIEVALFTVYEVAALLLNITAITPVKPVPVIVTLVPPPIGPTAGVIAVTVGFPKVNRSDGVVADVPLAVVTVISTVAVEP